MPVMRVRGPGGKIGYRWGRSGKIYYGSDARERAAEQGRAAYAAGYQGRARKNR